MRLLTRETPLGTAAAGPSDNGSTESLRALRGRGEGLLAASREATNRALSRDSQAFNRAVRQSGGQ